MARSSTPPRIAAMLAGSVLALSMSACTSATSTPTTTETSVSTTGTASTSAGKPGCDEAVAAFQDTTANLATKIHDLPSLQAFATDLVSRLHTAAAKATDPNIQSAIDKLADDLNALATSDQTSDSGQVQAELTALATDGQAVLAACR